MPDTDVDTNNPFLLVFNRFVDLIASPIDNYRGGHWFAALIALAFLVALVYALLYAGRRMERRRIARARQVEAAAAAAAATASRH